MTDLLVQQILIPIALAVLGAAVAWVAARGAQYLRKLQEQSESTILGHALDLVSRIAYPVVTEIAQTTISNLKAAREDGQLTAEEARAALKQAMQKTWGGLGEKARAALTEAAGGEHAAIETYIRPAVESAVATAKGTVPQPAPITDPERRAKETVLARNRLGLDSP